VKLSNSAGQVTSVIWDWNGTLLDDVDISLSAVNQLLAGRNLETITRDRYLSVFTFPVQDYYEAIGFDFSVEPFEVTAHQFIEVYNHAVRSCGLHDGALPVLEYLRNYGLKQYILSAMEQYLLKETVKHNNISSFFEGLYGLGDKYAVSKIEVGISLIGQHHLQPSHTLLIGDTVHDYEVARSVGCQCILIANGHQSRSRLESSGATVIDTLSDLMNGSFI
jgi:phosphoglycolate phosphatase